MNTNITNLLGAGSGINIRELAESLTAAERAPRQQVIDRNIERAEARISGLSVLSFVVGNLRDAFSALNDRSDFNRLDVRSSAPAVFGLEAGTNARPGRHSIEVSALAQAQHQASTGFASADSQINAGEPFTLTMSIGEQAPQAITVSTATPQGLVSAINLADTGVRAQLLDTGVGEASYQIVLTGQSGAAQTFTVAVSGGNGEEGAVQGLNFSTTQIAQDATLSINGLTVTRASNTIVDLIPGTTLNLFGTNAASPATVDLTRNTAEPTAAIRALVSAYNDAQVLFDELGRRDGGDEPFSGGLAGQPILRQISQQVRTMFTRDTSTPGGEISALRDVGLTLDRNGRMQLDETRLERALDEDFDNVVRMFSANTNNASNFGNFPRGLAGDAVKQLDDMLGFTGPLRAIDQSFNRDLGRHQSQLEKLEQRMEQVLARNIRQFSIMDGLVGELQSMRESLAIQFENMSSNLSSKRR